MDSPGALRGHNDVPFVTRVGPRGAGARGGGGCASSGLERSSRTPRGAAASGQGQQQRARTARRARAGCEGEEERREGRP
eukprot:5222881-Pyramimonas_sp.AAC.1